MGVRVVVGERELIGAALRRFKKQVERAGVPGEMRWHAYFVGGAELRRASGSASGSKPVRPPS
jgi:small subunit ribosomal protein S21